MVVNTNSTGLCTDDEMCLHQYNFFVIFIISDDGCHQPKHVADYAAS